MLANLPGAVELSYKFTVKANQSDLITDGKVTVSGDSDSTISTANDEITVSVPASKIGSGKTFTLTAATTDIGNYAFDAKWTKKDSSTASTNASWTYTFTANDDGEVLTAHYKINGTYVYFDATGFTNYTFYLQGIYPYSDVGMTQISGTNVFKSNSKVAYNYEFVVRTQGANVQSEHNNYGHVTAQNNYFGFGNLNNDGHYILTYKGNYTGTGS